MEKAAYIFLAVTVLATLTACVNSQTPDEDLNSGSSSSSSISSSSSSTTSESSTTSSTAPEPEIPDGEPTFLICPDGTPVYTSEISETYRFDEKMGEKDPITLEQAEQFAKEGSEFSVRCDGFAYGFTSEETLSCIDNPELFKKSDSGRYFEFLGEEFNENTFEGKYSTDYTRIKVGDKFGTLTVKSAYTLFSQQAQNRAEGEDFSDVPGVYLSGAEVEFDGETEMTGYVVIEPMDALYGEGGVMRFIPDNDSSLIIPKFDYFLNKNARCVCHFPHANSSGYCGTAYNIGNMFEVGCDTSGLHAGDFFVRVKVVLGDIKCTFGDLNRCDAELKSIEVL